VIEHYKIIVAGARELWVRRFKKKFLAVQAIQTTDKYEGQD
jgi:hypothetical protein